MPTSEKTPSRRLSLRHGAFALEGLDFDRGLAVRRGGERLALAGRNRGVALDQLGEHAAQGFDTERQRSHVEQQHVFDFAAEHAALNRRAYRDHFIGVHALVGLFVEELLDDGLDARDAGGTADQNDFVDLVRRHVGVLHGLFAGADGALEDVFAHLLEARAGELHQQVLGTGGIGRDERQIDVGFEQAWKAPSWPFRPLP